MTWPYAFTVGDLMRRAYNTPSEQAKRERLAELALWRDLHREAYGNPSRNTIRSVPTNERRTP